MGSSLRHPLKDGVRSESFMGPEHLKMDPPVGNQPLEEVSPDPFLCAAINQEFVLLAIWLKFFPMLNKYGCFAGLRRVRRTMSSIVSVLNTPGFDVDGFNKLSYFHGVPLY